MISFIPKIYAVSYRDIIPDNTKVINVTSRSTDGGEIFSPFRLGGVRSLNGYAKNVENYWQFSKVYPEHLDSNGNIKSEYFTWRDNGFKDSYAHRYPMGKGAIPLFHLNGTDRLEYQDAKKKIYGEIYLNAVRADKKCLSFLKHEIQNAIDGKYNLAFKDFDVSIDIWNRYDNIDDIIYSNNKTGHGYFVADMARRFIFNKTIKMII